MKISEIVKLRCEAIDRRRSYQEKDRFIEKVAERLEKYGFTREVAGEKDFLQICRASAKAEVCGLCLLITGPVGVGKTTAARALRPSWRLIPMGGYLPDDFAASRADRRNYRAWDKAEGEFETGHIIIDDLGQEPIVNNYGVKSELLADYLEWAYDRRESWCFGQPVITTNLSLNDIARRYGARIDSRLFEMCVSVRMTGTDKRKQIR